jgi:hypothetical protein
MWKHRVPSSLDSPLHVDCLETILVHPPVLPKPLLIIFFTNPSVYVCSFLKCVHTFLFHYLLIYFLHIFVATYNIIVNALYHIFVDFGLSPYPITNFT